MRHIKLSIVMGLTGILTACGSTVGATGELGRMTFSLGADYELEGPLTEVGIVTGHEQVFFTTLTKRGHKFVDEPGDIGYRLEPARGTTVDYYPGDDGDETPPHVTLTVSQPGNYILEAVEDDEVVDYVDLRFRRPSRLDVVSWIKPPGDDSFSDEEQGDRYTVEEGAQVALVPIPIGKDGERLVGDYWMDVTFTPEWAAIHTSNVLDVYEEEGVWGSQVTESLVFIEPAEVTVFIEDAPNGLVGTIAVEVTERPREE